jgi:hypothetical protein
MADIMGDHEFCDSRLAQVNYKGQELDYRTSVSAGTLRVYNSLWDTLTIEMSQQINQVEIL